MKSFNFFVPVGDKGGTTVTVQAENEEEALEKVHKGEFRFYSAAYRVEEAVLSVPKSYSCMELTEQQKRESL